jgi:hypothetical protein
MAHFLVEIVVGLVVWVADEEGVAGEGGDRDAGFREGKESVEDPGGPGAGGYYEAGTRYCLQSVLLDALSAVLGGLLSVSVSSPSHIRTPLNTPSSSLTIPVALAGCKTLIPLFFTVCSNH